MAFTQEIFDFLSELKDNNNKEWFTANKKRYETHVKDACLQFIRDFEPELKKVSPHYKGVAKASGGSMMRIYRDTRFSKDKTPYKTRMAMHFMHEVGKAKPHPGFYIGISPGESGTGAGMWGPDKEPLLAIRTKIANEPEAWSAVKASLQDGGLQFMNDASALKRPPKGFDKDHVHIEDIKRKSFAVHSPLSDAVILADDLPEQFADACRRAMPFVRFLAEAVDIEV